MDYKSYIFGEYVLQPIQNAFNGKVSFWLSKRYMTVALYCFSVRAGEDIDFQLQNIQSYIHLFFEKFES